LPKFYTGEMFHRLGAVDLFCVTTNSTVTSKNELVMGAGAARQLVEAFPGIKAIAYQHLAKDGRDRVYRALHEYNLCIFEIESYLIGLFQTKSRYDRYAVYSIIQNSIDRLAAWCEENPGKTVALNYPGVGKGKIVADKIHPFVMKLPKQVEVWVDERFLTNYSALIDSEIKRIA